MKRKSASDAEDPPPTKRPVGRPRKKPAKASSPAPPITPSSPRRTRHQSSKTGSSSDSDKNPTEDDGEVLGATHDLLGFASHKAPKSRVSGSEDEEDKDEVMYVDSEGEEEVDQEDQEQNATSEDEDTEFTVDFLVPADGAVDEKSFLSTVNPSRFFRKIAEEMDIDRSDLKIGYKFSTWKAADPPRKLETRDHLEQLFSKAKDAMDQLAASKSKTKRQFQVSIVDLASKEKRKGAKAKDKGKGKGKAKSSRRQDSSESDDADEPPKRKSGADYLRELEAKHKCDKHSGFCFVGKDGEHVPLSNQKLSLWSMLALNDKSVSVTVPPPVLGLNLDGTAVAPPTRRANNTAPAPAAHTDPYHPYTHFYHPPPYYAPPPQAPAPPAATVPQPSTLNKGASLDSQDEPPTVYPKVDDWLLDLDNSERGADGQNFYAYAPALLRNGYTRIIQIAEEGDDGVQVLREICSDMTIGTAKLILRYAKKDCKEIRRVERKHRAEWEAK
ncbi:hypothetical protein C8R46DRAFT_1223421 [Mycena filopes]|nr:hypothetical protein C8R46DRAFT_1223421 [Mycena filopes]